MSTPALQIWRKNATLYGDFISQAMIGVLRSDRRELATYITKLSRSKEFRRFCGELNPAFFDILVRFIQGESRAILERELFGASAVLAKLDVTSDQSVKLLSKLYAQYLSANLLDNDPFKGDEVAFRDNLKVATSLSSSHRRIEEPTFGNGNVVESLKGDSAMLYKTRFRTLNHFFGGGLRARRLYTIGGAPGVGKSAMLLNMFVDAAWNCADAVYVTLENSIEETRRRMVANLLNMDLSTLFLDQEETQIELARRLEQYKDHIARIDKFGTVVELTSITIDEIREIIEERRPKVLVLDYLNLITHVVYRDIAKDLEDLTMSLARLAKEYHIAIITACQLNRGALQVPEPDESHVGESFGIVKATDIFFTLYPYRGKDDQKDAEVADPRTETRQVEASSAVPMVLRIAKSRFTPLGQVPLICRKNVVYFTEV